MMSISATYLTELHRLLNQHFNLDELRTLCFKLNVDYESVPGAEKSSKVRELLLAFGRNGRLPELVSLAQQERPDVAWPPLPEDLQLPASLPFAGTAIAVAKERPMQLPRRAEHFHGREELIEEVLRELHPGSVVTLYGIGGIGKTAVTAEVAAQLATRDGPPERFPDGVIFHSFYGRPSTGVALEHLLNSLGIERKGDLDDNARAALGGKKLLLILDGSEEADHLARLVSLAPSCGVLISSRKKADVFEIGYPVKRLDIDDAESVLAGWAAGRVDGDGQSREICELLGNLPLAVRLAGKYIASSGLTAGEYLGWLRSTGLEALDFGQRREESVRFLLARSVAQVGEAAQQALAVAGRLALAPFKAEPVAATLAKTIFATRNDLGALVNFGLLERPSVSYVVSHPLVHTFARKELNLAEGQLLKLAGYYITFSREESEKGPEGFVRLDGERAHIMRVIRVCEESEAWAVVDKLIWAVRGYLDRQGHTAERIVALQAGVRVARVTGNRRDEGAHLGNLGRAYGSLGQMPQAIDFHQQALAIAQKIGDRRAEGNHLGNLGLAYADLGQVLQAIDFYQQALVISQEIGDRRGEGNCLGNLGRAYANLGQVQQAIDFCQQALAIARDSGDRRAEGNHLGNLGLAYRMLGQVQKAIDFYQQALAIAQEIGDRRAEGNHLGNLGFAYRNLGQVQKAIDFYQQALTIAQEIGDRHGEGAHLGNLGLAYADLGQVQKAIDYHQQALTIAQEIGDRRGEGADLGNLGNAYYSLGQVQQAIDYHQQALAISQEIGDRRGEGADLGNLGNAYDNLGQVEKAIDFYQQALAISQEIGDRHGEGNHLGNLGNVYANLGQVEKAIDFYQRTLVISQEIGDRRGEGADLGNLGLAYAALGQVEKATEYLQQSMAIFVEIKDPRAKQVRNELERLKTANSQLSTKNEQPPASLT